MLSMCTNLWPSLPCRYMAQNCAGHCPTVTTGTTATATSGKQTVWVGTGVTMPSWIPPEKVVAPTDLGDAGPVMAFTRCGGNVKFAYTDPGLVGSRAIDSRTVLQKAMGGISLEQCLLAGQSDITNIYIYMNMNMNINQNGAPPDSRCVWLSDPSTFCAGGQTKIEPRLKSRFCNKVVKTGKLSLCKY